MDTFYVFYKILYLSKKKKEKDLIWTYYSAASFIYLTEFNIKTNVSL
jgi:hypothetical protein